MMFSTCTSTAVAANTSRFARGDAVEDQRAMRLPVRTRRIETDEPLPRRTKSVGCCQRHRQVAWENMSVERLAN